MKDQDKTKGQLTDELVKLRKRNAELEGLEIKYKQSEKALANERFKSKECFEKLPILVYHIGLDGKILDCNNLVVKKLGYKSKKEVIGKPLITTIYTPSSREKGKKLFLKWKKTGKVKNEELQIVTKQGELLDILLNADKIYNKESKLLYSISTQVDITERKKAEAKLQESREELRSIFDSSPDAITVTDLNGVIKDCNQATLDLQGYSSKQEVIGKNSFELIASKDHERAKKNMEKTTKQGLEKNIKYTFVRKDGSEFPAELSASVLRDVPGRVTGFVAITKDISDRKKAEKTLEESESKLQEQKLALEQKNIALREIIAQIEIEKRKIKDDLRTNVNMVLSPILERLRIDEATQKYVNLLQHHIEGLTSSYGSKIREKSVKLTPREMEVCNLVKGGLSSKEISKILNISCQTVVSHRKKIRYKLGVSNKDINLCSFLREF